MVVKPIITLATKYTDDIVGFVCASGLSHQVLTVYDMPQN